MTACPWPLHAAVDHALTVLGFFELPDDERPPQGIWADPEAVGEFFERVAARRQARASGMEVVDDDAAAPLLTNEVTRGW